MVQVLPFTNSSTEADPTQTMEDQGTHTEAISAEGPRTTGGSLPELASLMEVVCVMIEDREREITEEYEHREQEKG